MFTDVSVLNNLSYFKSPFSPKTLDVYSFRDFRIFPTTDIYTAGETLASFLLTWLNDVYFC